MWCKGPEDVFLPADFAKAQAAGIDVLQSADFSVFDHFFEPDDRGMVVKNVADKECFLFLRGQAYQFFAVGLIEGKGLFYKDVLPGVEGLFGDFVVKSGRGGDDDGLDAGILKHPVDVVGYGNIRVGFDHVFTNVVRAVADGFKDAKLVEVADKVFTPVACADDRYRGRRPFNVQGSRFYVRSTGFKVQGSRFYGRRAVFNVQSARFYGRRLF